MSDDSASGPAKDRPADTEPCSASDDTTGSTFVSLERPTRYDRSLRIRLHNAYFQQRGLAAWGKEEVPYHATTNIALARQHVTLLQRWVQQAEAEGRLGLDDRVRVMEVGGGAGFFALTFRRALRELAPTLASRVTYLHTDYAVATLAELAGRPEISTLRADGLLRLGMFDLSQPDSPVASFDGDHVDQPPHWVIANYVCCVVGTSLLQVDDDVWSERYVATRVHDDALRDLSQAQRANFVEELLARAGEKRLVEKLRFDWSWRPVDLKQRFDDPLDQHVIRAIARGSDELTLNYPHVFVHFLRALAPWLAKGGLVVVNDFGTAHQRSLEGLSDTQPQDYGNSVALGVAFTLFDVLADALGWHHLRSQNNVGSLMTAVISPTAPIGDPVRSCFERVFEQERPNDDLLDFAAAGERYHEAHDHERALRFYLRCIAIDGDEGDYFYRAAESALETDNLELALTLAKDALRLEVSDEFDAPFLLGRIYCLLGDYQSSLRFYQRSLEHDEHAVTLTNMGVLYEHFRDADNARACYKRAIATDPDCDRAKRLLNKLGGL